MTTTSSPHARPDRGHRFLTSRRGAAAAAVFAIIIGAPFVVRALADDSGEAEATIQGTVAEPDPASSRGDTEAVLGDPPADGVMSAVDDDNRGSGATDIAEDDITQNNITQNNIIQNDITADDITADDTIAPAPIDVHELLTGPYSWDERTLRVAALQRLLNVEVDGWYSPDTRLVHLEFLEFTGLDTGGVPDPAPPGPSAEEWAALRACESGGDYSIVSSTGRYRGAYQFARTTWDSVASRHFPSLVGIDPATVPVAEQDAMARALYGEAGAGPWPVCGRHLS